MPIAATSPAAPLAPRASGADARGQALAGLPALTPSAHVPSHGAALEAWICALLLALFGRMEAFRQLFPQESAYPIDEDDAETLRQIAHAIRAANRLRAWIGWILRFEPNHAMRCTFGRLTPELRAKPARAPPRPRVPMCRPHPITIRAENPASGGDDSCPDASPALTSFLGPRNPSRRQPPAPICRGSARRVAAQAGSPQLTNSPRRQPAACPARPCRRPLARTILALALLAAALAPLALAPPAHAQTPDAELRAQLWEACLVGGLPESLIGLCGAALDQPGLEAGDTALLLAQRGNALAAINEWDRALIDLTRAIELDPEQPMALLVRGVGLVNRGQPEHGIADLTVFLRHEPGHAGALNARAIALVLTGRPAAALADFNAALAAAPDNLILLRNRGNALRDSGNVEAALRDYDRALLLGGRDARILTDRCLARLVRGDIRRALADCDSAVEMAPDQGGLIENRGIAQLKWRNWAAALADFDLALRLDPSLVWSLYGRGIARLRHGDTAGGAADIRAAQAANPNVAAELARYGIMP